MQDALSLYFDGEKSAALFITGAGVASIVAAVLLFRTQRSLSVTLAVFSLIEIALGAGLYLRTGPQVERLVALRASDSARFRAEEASRMERVQRNFVWIEIAEASIIVASIAAILLLKNRIGITGVACGLLIHASILLAFDLIAERRGAVYLESLRHVSPQ